VTARQHFEALYGNHAGAVLAYARRRTTPSNADDVLAEVFLIAWRRLQELPPDPRVWLLATARRVLANQRRSQARQSALRSRLSREPTEPRSPTIPEAGATPVRHALAQLSEKDREALLLLGWEELTHREAAHVLGIRERTFSVRLHRARRRFALALAAAGQPPASVAEPIESQEVN
jgi:RNA polymerase sigma factor (sigma-70 family)